MRRFIGVDVGGVGWVDIVIVDVDAHGTMSVIHADSGEVPLHLIEPTVEIKIKAVDLFRLDVKVGNDLIADDKPDRPWERGPNRRAFKRNRRRQRGK